ncbi:MAG TPA: hypothetical protein VF867_15245 [Arthrobacter sp.]
MSHALTAAHPDEYASVSRANGARPGAETHPAHRIFASTSDLLAGHQPRFTAGVKGCTCGELFPEDSDHLFSTLHAIHLAPLVVSHVLRAGAAALREDLEPDAAAAAVSALAAMVRNESKAPQRKTATP